MLTVPKDRGPAGVHREHGDVNLDRRGGTVSFEVPSEERVYFWWRGASPPGLRALTQPSRRVREATRIA
jgi:hypothetical protein